MANELAIVLPVYKEGQLVTATIDLIADKVKTDFHIFAVYDFEDDPTLPFLKKYPAIVSPVRNKYGRGALNAIKTGMEVSKEPYVVVLMADLSEDPIFINDMVSKAKEGYDLICGSRYMKGGEQIGGPVIKGFLSRMAGLSLNLLTGIPTHDISNSFKLYSRKVLDSIAIESTGGFEIGMEITVKAYLAGYKICEIPSVWRDRVVGKSNFKLMRWLPKYLKWYFYLIWNKWSKKPYR